VPGNPVRVAGADVGTVEDLSISENGEALVRFTVDEEYAPLRRGTRAMSKQTSLSGIANRDVDLHLGPADGAEIEDGGRLSTNETVTAVEIDQFFSIFDPKNRQALKDTVRARPSCCAGGGMK
jgi:phospholipid/cholesterol/gamma-HCH transport system substrate-binding protein